MTIVYQEVIHRISLDFCVTVLCVTLPCKTVLPAPLIHIKHIVYNALGCPKM